VPLSKTGSEMLRRSPPVPREVCLRLVFQWRPPMQTFLDAKHLAKEKTWIISFEPVASFRARRAAVQA
jgi:hypothetical protein